MKIVLISILAYMIGTITAGYFVGLLLFGEDIRTQGSSNPGTTNAFRTMGIRAGILTLIIDFFKGFIACLIGILIEPVYGVYIGALFVILGHNFPFHLRFKGGKGVATSAGVVMFFSPLVIILLILIFVIIVFLTKKVSLGSIISAILAPLLAYYFERDIYFTIFITFLAILLLIRHRSNIQRLIKGEESDFRFRKRSNMK